MPAPRKYDVLVDGRSVYYGLLRTAELVFSACSQSVLLATPAGNPVPVVTLAVHFEHPNDFAEEGGFLSV